MKKLLVASVASLTLLACSDSSPTDPSTITGKLVVSVFESGSNARVANVVVELRREASGPNGPIAFSGTTNALGVADIGVPRGGFWIRLVLPPGYSLAASNEQDKFLFLGSGIATLTFIVMKQ